MYVLITQAFYFAYCLGSFVRMRDIMPRLIFAQIWDGTLSSVSWNPVPRSIDDHSYAAVLRSSKFTWACKWPHGMSTSRYVELRLRHYTLIYRQILFSEIIHLWSKWNAEVSWEISLHAYRFGNEVVSVLGATRVRFSASPLTQEGCRACQPCEAWHFAPLTKTRFCDKYTSLYPDLSIYLVSGVQNTVR